jgi:propionyl-CoA carboxylase alpha chain
MPVITKLLIANRAEIVSRVVRTGRAMGIATVAVYSDADAALPYVADADEAVHLPGAAPADTYLRIDAIIDAARRVGADAVHPGYGFLSENAAFARACIDAGLIWVGPPPEAIDAMGSKVTAKGLMADAGVPVLPGFLVTTTASAEELDSAADKIGYPVLVKAAFGGGGRGMRIVSEGRNLAAAVAAAQAEATSAFGDGTVFLERYVEAPRHIEVQVMADAHGTVAHLFERECSIQRRHQKVLEEAPSAAVDEALREELCGAAVAAAKAIGYVGAGTVEFVLDADGRFAFLEVNTRLQVEHPVTEMITGLDLVRLQLRVAEGDPLPSEVLDARIVGHAIEVRLYAEDVTAGFLPVSGPLHRFRLPLDVDVRVDSGYSDGSVVSTHYDAMLAKVIAWAPTRAEAAAKLADALDRAEVHGVATNRALLVGTLREREFLAGGTDTAYLERHDPARLGEPDDPTERDRVHAVAAALAACEECRVQLPTPVGIPVAWRNVGPADQPFAFESAGTRVDADLSIATAVHEVSGELADIEVAGTRRRIRLQRVGSTWYADSSLGHSVLREVPRFPMPGATATVGSLLAPMPGTVISVHVEPGETVVSGQPVAVLEAMKMQHTIRAPHAGMVREVRVVPGEQVDGAAVLAVIDELGEELA